MNLKKKHGELILALIMLAFGAFYLIMTTQIQIKESDALHSAFVPRILGFLILVVGALQLWRGISELHRPGADEARMGEGNDNKMVLITLAILIAYIALLSFLGFVVSSVAYLFVMFMIWTPESKKRNVPLYITISLVSGIGVYLAFRYGLDLMLPRGILTII